MATNSTPHPTPLKKKKLSKKYQLKNVSVNKKKTIASYKINIRKAVDP